MRRFIGASIFPPFNCSGAALPSLCRRLLAENMLSAPCKVVSVPHTILALSRSSLLSSDRPRIPSTSSGPGEGGDSGGSAFCVGGAFLHLRNFVPRWLGASASDLPG